MAPHDPIPPGENPPKEERRLIPRLRARGVARIIRADDVMRVGIEGRVRDISPGGVGAELPIALEIDEHVKIRLENQIQRFECEVRGVVRHVTSRENAFYVGVELFTRLTPRQVSMLKTSLPVDEAGESGRI